MLDPRVRFDHHFGVLIFVPIYVRQQVLSDFVQIRNYLVPKLSDIGLREPAENISTEISNQIGGGGGGTRSASFCGIQATKSRQVFAAVSV